MSLDAVNALFEMAGTVFVLRNVVELWRAKRAVGVYLPIQGFYGLWGAWNLYYYAGIGHWLSFAGQVGMVAGNLAWLALALWFRRKS